MLRTLPALPMLRTLPTLPMLRMLPALPILRMLAALNRLHRLRTLRVPARPAELAMLSGDTLTARPLHTALSAMDMIQTPFFSMVG
jgi:hypothetical protein